MNFEQCIKLTMQALILFLESKAEYINDSNFNTNYISLTEEGFILEEENRFGSEYTYGREKIYVSPLYVLSRLFDGDETKKDSITIFAREISEQKFSSSISYVRIVDLIDKIRDNYNRGLTENVLDINYIKLKKLLNSTPKDNYISLKNQVLSIKNLDFEDIANLRNTKRDLARKIERMYQVEFLLRKYCIKKMVSEGLLNIPQQDYNQLIDYSFISKELINEIDLSKVKITWADFCNLVREANEEEINVVNQEWKNERGQSNPKLTVLGLDIIALPSNPSIQAKRFR